MNSFSSENPYWWGLSSLNVSDFILSKPHHISQWQRFPSNAFTSLFSSFIVTEILTFRMYFTFFKHWHLLIMLTSFVTGYSSWYSTIEIASQELWKTNWNQLWQLFLCSIACARLFPHTILSDCRQFSLRWPIQLHFRLYSVSMHTPD